MDNILFSAEKDQAKEHLNKWNICMSMGPGPKFLSSQPHVSISDLFNAEEGLPAEA